jgi:hypothetical protein
VEKEESSVTETKTLQNPQNSYNLEVEFLADEVKQESDGEESEDPSHIPYSYRSGRADSQGYCHAHNEKKGREDKIGRGESMPLSVIEEPRGVGDWSHVVDEDHANHGESSVDIETLYSNFWFAGGGFCLSLFSPDQF